MVEYKDVVLEVLGVPVTCNLCQGDDSITSEISEDIVWKCYKKALFYLVFGDIPDTMTILVEYGKTSCEVCLYRTIAGLKKTFWLRMVVDCGVQSRMSMSSSLCDYLVVSSNQQIPFSLFTIQE
jgi:hypothetical protein